MVKDDGLAAGKGVVVTADRDAARAHAASLLDAGHPVLLESFLDGPEVSLFCVVDGETVVPLLPAQDFKRVGDGDTGPNTGGMGAYAPLPWLPDDVIAAIVDDVVKPVAAELVRRGSSFSGLLYAGLAITSHGPGGRRIQLPLRRSRDAVGAGAAGHRRSASCCTPRPPVNWPSSRRCAGATAPRSPSCSPPRTIRAGPRVGDVIVGSEADGVLHAGTTRRDDGADRLVGRAGAVGGRDGRRPRLPRVRPPTRVMRSIRLPGSHFRTDIGLAAAEGQISSRV